MKLKFKLLRRKAQNRKLFLAVVVFTFLSLLMFAPSAAYPTPSHPLSHIHPTDTNLNMSNNSDLTAYNITGTDWLNPSTPLTIGSQLDLHGQLNLNQNSINDFNNLYFSSQSGDAFFVQNNYTSSQGGTYRFQARDTSGTKQLLLKANPAQTDIYQPLDLNGNDLTSVGNVTLSGDMGITGGNVGVGTNSPDQSVHVMESGGHPSMKLEADRLGSTSNGQATGALMFYGENSAGEQIQGARLIHRFDNVTDGSEDGQYEFENIVGGSIQDAMVIEGGKVGIGTTDPSIDLDVNDWIGLGSPGHSDWDSFNQGLVFDSLSHGLDSPGAMITYEEIGNHGADMIFAVRHDSGGSGNEVMRITENERVGISTTDPDAKLDVEGGNLDLSGNKLKDAQTQSASFYDDFDDNTGNNWIITGSASVTNNRMDGGGSEQVYPKGVDIFNGYIEFWDHTSSGDSPFMMRWDGDYKNSATGIACEGQSTNGMDIYEYDEGSQNNIASASFSFSPPTHKRMTVIGDQVWCEVDDNMDGTYEHQISGTMTQANLIDGTYGKVGHADLDSDKDEFDNFRAVSLPSRYHLNDKHTNLDMNGNDINNAGNLINTDTCTVRTRSECDTCGDSYTISCNSGEIMLSGGCSYNDIPGSSTAVDSENQMSSYPVDQNTWKCAYDDPNEGITLHILCCDIG